jgi:hypothetical protein
MECTNDAMCPVPCNYTWIQNGNCTGVCCICFSVTSDWRLRQVIGAVSSPNMCCTCAHCSCNPPRQQKEGQ